MHSILHFFEMVKMHRGNLFMEVTLPEVLNNYLRYGQRFEMDLLIYGATLFVYYGFSEAFMKWGKASMSNFDEWLRHMKTLLKQPGIRYIGMVGHGELAEAYASSGFSLYPTSFPETGCVSLMKAQAMGSIPITSRYTKSTLPELTAEFDLGPPSRPGKISDDPEWLNEWAASVITAAGATGERLISMKKHRENMIHWARKKFLWSHVAHLWHRSFQRGGERLFDDKKQKPRSIYFDEETIDASHEAVFSKKQ
eukprot:GSMAST32.ASY1.ANO1.1873.1 assembled CDS